jgi:hypothetical protein
VNHGKPPACGFLSFRKVEFAFPNHSEAFRKAKSVFVNPESSFAKLKSSFAKPKKTFRKLSFAFPKAKVIRESGIHLPEAINRLPLSDVL